MKKMYNELLVYYPNLKLGSYTMFANNIHIYERNFEIYKSICENPQLTNSISIESIIDNQIYDKLMKL